MTTRFYCMWRGRKLFRVLRERDELFCGTAEECKRFLEIHHGKVERQRVQMLRPPRRRYLSLRIFRMAPRGLSRAAV
jgi:hypothetical protein